MCINLRILLVGVGSSSAALDGRLRGLGHSVCAAAAPGEAVDKAAALGPDLVLADLEGDPAWAGAAAAERCGAPLVCLVGGAGDAADGLLEPGRTAVPVGFAAKPAGARQLRLTIDAAWSARARERAIADEARRAADEARRAADEQRRRAAEQRRRAAELRRRVAGLQRDAAITRTVFDAIHQPVVAVSTAGEFLMVNDAARTTFVGDAPPGPDVVFGQYDVFRTDGRTPFPRDELPLVRARRGEPSTDVEMMVRRSGASASDDVFVSVSGRPLQDADGALMGGVIVVNNVTRIKETEKRLREAIVAQRQQRRLMEAVLDAMHEGVAAVGVDGERLVVNRAVRDLVDLNVRPGGAPLDDEHLKRYDIRRADGVTPYPVDDLPLLRALRGEEFDGVEMVLPRADGTGGRYVSASGGPLLDDAGAVQAGVVVIHDVTEIRKREIELKRTAAELHEHAQLMDTIFENMSDGVVVADGEGRLTLLNPSAVRLVGFGRTGMSWKEWSRRCGFFHPDQATPFAAEESPLARAIRGGSSDDVEMFVRNPQVPGGAFISADGRPLRDESGAVTGAVTVVRDLSQSVAAKEAFVSGRLEVVDTILHNIGNAINSVAVGADTLHDELRGNELIGRFAALAKAFAAHRDDEARWLQQDPQGCKAVPFLLALAGDFTAQNHRLLHTADRVRDRVRHIVDIIRTERSLAGGRQEQKVVDLPGQLADAVGVLRELLAQRGIDVEVDCGRAPGQIRIHESRFHQLMVNLVRNAMEAIDERAASGGFGRDEPRLIRIDARLDRDYLVIDVTDNGIGISPGRMRSIFSAGYTTKKSGTGLGLHSAANFVIGMGGRISPSSRGVGRGATLRVMLRRSGILPKSSEAAAAGDSKAASGASASTRA